MKLFLTIFLLIFIILFCYSTKTNTKPKKKKDVRDMTDKEIEALYDEWEANDEDKLLDDEKPPYLRPKTNIDFDSLKKMSNSPDDMMRLSKKGQSIMMFVSVVDVKAKNGKTEKEFTNRLSTLWHSMLINNHVEAQVYVIEDDRMLFMFMDGSRAWESRDFLLKQPECKEITLEGKVSKGPASLIKKEL